MSRRKALILFGVSSLFLGMAVLSSGHQAESAFPGANGKIAFNSLRDGHWEIYLMEADGSGETRCTTSSISPAQESADPSFSPDGSKIAFQINNLGGSEYAIYVMKANCTEPTRLTNNSPVDDLHPSWSPDGSKIVFMSNRDGNNGEIYSMNADGSGQTRLTNDPARDDFSSWSPDGTEIAWSTNRDGNWEVYKMNAADGSGQTNCTNNPAADNHPSWSPNGTEIAFISDRGSPDLYPAIHKMNAACTEPTQLNSNWPGEAVPDWSPDGFKIIFRSDRDGPPGGGNAYNEIYSMNADGSGPTTRLTTNAASDSEPAWQPLVDSDGDALYDSDELIGVPAAKGGPYITNPLDPDTDDDGCTDGREVTADETSGGRRNPTNPNDYFNPSGDRQNRVDDILMAKDAYFKDDNDGNPGLPPYAPGYTPNTDRTLKGPNLWNTGPPNGLQRVDDILHAVKSYFHDCI